MTLIKKSNINGHSPFKKNINGPIIEVETS